MPPKRQTPAQQRASKIRIFAIGTVIIGIACFILYSIAIRSVDSTTTSTTQTISTGEKPTFYEFNPKFNKYPRIVTKTKPEFTLLDVPVENRKFEQLPSSGVLEPHVTGLIRDLAEHICEKERVFFDVSANSGYYSMYAAKLHCVVISFQADPLYYQLLFSEAALNNIRKHKYDVFGDNTPKLDHFYSMTKQSRCSSDYGKCFKENDGVLILRIDRPKMDDVMFVLANSGKLFSAGVVRNLIIKVYERGDALLRLMKVVNQEGFAIFAVTAQDKAPYYSPVKIDTADFKDASREGYEHEFDHLWCIYRKD